MSLETSSKTIIPESKILATIRAGAAKQGKNKLSMREIDDESVPTTARELYLPIRSKQFNRHRAAGSGSQAGIPGH